MRDSDQQTLQQVNQNNIEVGEYRESGLYGAVYKGRQTRVDRPVAVKIIHPSMAQYTDVLNHARGLVRAGQHDRIVTLYDVTKVVHPDTGDMVDAVILEWLDGKTLLRRLAESDFLSKDDFCLYASGIIDGLEFLHSKGLVHGDLHEANIILTDNGPKLIDIDYAKEETLALLTTLERSGRICNDVRQAGLLLSKMLTKSNLLAAECAPHEIALRSAATIGELRDSVSAINTQKMSVILPQQQPPSPPQLFKEIKKCLRRRDHIRKHDLLVKESNCIVQSLLEDFPSSGGNNPADELPALIARFDHLVLELVKALGVGCFWDSPRNSSTYVMIVNRVANAYEENGPWGGKKWLLDFRHYPTLLLVYAAGLGAVANEKYRTLRTILDRTTYYRHGQEKVSLGDELWHFKQESRDWWNANMHHKRRLHTPISDHLHDYLREPFRGLVPQSKTYSNAFDQFEYLAGLTYSYSHSQHGGRPWGPVGRFIWAMRGNEPIGEKMLEDLQSGEPYMRSIRDDLFNGEEKRLTNAITGFESHVAAVQNQMMIR